ncbi:MAG: PepSY domain-containing protein [Sphingomonadaceae bacterium]|uniref:hypothetical protein n=1 Tax=Thermaurantiacus sp. TaxID=2820283 RepID=UPI00298F271A|nr:hypothetical protein [Thermaurantiacus sp.]MCS6986034.1 PepSY domain-containing protein [Sphingomonadaceae bacterium]MDW8414750.1 hypothetical protein [Thermaurantiacus sp.]
MTHTLARRRLDGRLLAIRWHQRLALLGALALMLWGASGLLHPVMTSFGPQQAVFLPPARPIDLGAMRPVADILAEAGVTRAQLVRIVTGPQGNLLQVTEREREVPRYFRLDDGRELPGHDRAQAVWLARHYSGLAQTPVASVERIEGFSARYPAVNRLLPVWRVTFDRSDGLSYVVHTETSAVAAVDDRVKQRLQTAFQWVHTLSWLPRGAEPLRVALISLAVGSLVVLAISGIAMLFLIRRRSRPTGVRGWHRTAAWALAVPLFLFAGSGLFHLFQHAGEVPATNLRLSPPVDVATADPGLPTRLAQLTGGGPVNALSLVADGRGVLLYRIEPARPQATAPATAAAIRAARFAGAPRSEPPIYVEAATGRVRPDADRALALDLGRRFTGLGPEAVERMELVTRFGPLYDFRNKRLPVWRLDYGPPVSATLFVDTATGVLVDVVADAAKPERFSFSFLHKWNFLFPLGRDGQNAVVAAVVLALIGFMAWLGLRMDLARRAARRRR